MLNKDQNCHMCNCASKIIDSKRGSNGFGYDPVFMPEGSDKSFAEMSMDEKSVFSHRKKAVKKMISFLHQSNSNS